MGGTANGTGTFGSTSVYQCTSQTSCTQRTFSDSTGFSGAYNLVYVRINNILDRPRQTVGHEFGHGIGLRHATGYPNSCSQLSVMNNVCYRPNILVTSPVLDDGVSVAVTYPFN